MRKNTTTDTERGQAHTLEGFIGAMVVLMAVLFAVQSVVITPTTGGAVDRTVQSQLQTEAQDALVVADSEGNLSEMVRYWNVTDDEVAFANATAPGDGEYTTDEFQSEFLLGTILGERFGSQGQNYNVELHTQNGSETAAETLVYQGQPSANAFTASYTVTLYDDQNVTYPEDDEETLGSLSENDNYDNDELPIPREESNDGTVYNVVEVRVIVW